MNGKEKALGFALVATVVAAIGVAYKYGYLNGAVKFASSKIQETQTRVGKRVNTAFNRKRKRTTTERIKAALKS